MNENYQPVQDLLIIGGGINGTGIANDAAGRGLSVTLCEKGDLASATSSASSKLIHGGLRYLEHYEFRLVRESLSERETLLAKAPHIVWPLKFVLPHKNEVRPAWLIRIGLFLYDHLARHPRLPNSGGVRLREAAWGKPLHEHIDKGFFYSDCWVDDARLVVLNAMQARNSGATVLTRTEVMDAKRSDGVWVVRVKDLRSGNVSEIRSRVMVNAAGPWAQSVLDRMEHVETNKTIRLVKGSHIIVPRIHDGEQAYILQHTDHRIVFVLPYEGDFSLIGTTEEVVGDGLDRVRASDLEISYLCSVVNGYFKNTISPEDVVWSYAGVRPLFDNNADNPSAVTRDYVLELDEGGLGDAPVLSVFGGKITTYRRLAEQVIETLKPHLPPMVGAWTKKVPLPGGEIDNADFNAFLQVVREKFPWLDEAVLRALARRHGSNTMEMLDGVADMNGLGQHFGWTLYAREVDYLISHEWACTAEDVLWRRTKAGLHLNAEQVATVRDYIQAKGGMEFDETA